MYQNGANKLAAESLAAGVASPIDLGASPNASGHT